MLLATHVYFEIWILCSLLETGGRDNVWYIALEILATQMADFMQQGAQPTWCHCYADRLWTSTRFLYSETGNVKPADLRSPLWQNYNYYHCAWRGKDGQKSVPVEKTVLEWSNGIGSCPASGQTLWIRWLHSTLHCDFLTSGMRPSEGSRAFLERRIKLKWFLWRHRWILCSFWFCPHLSRELATFGKLALMIPGMANSLPKLVPGIWVRQVPFKYDA